MHKKKLIRIIVSMDDQELKACRKFLKATLSSSSDAQQLFDYIWSTRKNFQSKKLEIERARVRLKPHITPKSFLNILSSLTKQIELFWLIRELSSETRKFDYALMLGAIYKKKGLYSCFDEIHKELDTFSQEMTPLDLKKNWQLMRRHEQIFFSESLPKEGRIHELVKADEHLKKFYAEWRLFCDIEAINQKKIFNKENLFPAVYDATPLENFLQKLAKLVESDDLESFVFLENILFNQPTILSKQLAQITLIYLINSCSYYINLGQEAFIDKLANFYDLGFENELLLYHGKLLEKHFLNAIDANTKAKTASDTTVFIEKWILQTASKNPTALKNVAYAMHHFSKENYAEALQFASAPQIITNNLNLSLRAQLIKICSLCSLYEEYSHKQEVLRNVLSFFKRHQADLNPVTFEGITNLIEIIRMIWYKKPLLEIKNFINNSKTITFRYWINKRLTK